ncbi:MAG: Rap1a/Tai family immunity protein [Gammaproteobacteria bacterium]
MKIQKKLIFPLSLLFSLMTVDARAESEMPGGAELLAACQYAQKYGYDNTRGMLCIWYVTPCDCEITKDENIPRVCLPTGIDHTVLAQRVIQGLLDNPGLQAQAAELAAARILSQDYPCDG